jgi:hypothetical protein
MGRQLVSKYIVGGPVSYRTEKKMLKANYCV